MANISTVQRGLTKYIEVDIAPKVSGIKGAGILFYALLVIQNLPKNIQKIAGYTDLTGAINGDEVDVAALYGAAKTLTKIKPFTFDLGVGTLTIPDTDIDKIYNYIMGG